MKRLVYITLLCLVWFAPGRGQVVLSLPLDYISVGVGWTPPAGQVSHYVLRIFTRTGLNDSVAVADTTTRVFFPKKYLTDSIFVEVRAVDSLGQSSAFSARVAAIPEVIQMDWHRDEKKRIDVEDYQAFYKAYKRTFGRTLYKEVNKK